MSLVGNVKRDTKSFLHGGKVTAVVGGVSRLQ